MHTATDTVAGGNLHWFLALKAKATGKYHNVFDAVGDQSMCLWVDKSNQYEFNNCAGSAHDTLRSKVYPGNLSSLNECALHV